MDDADAARPDPSREEAGAPPAAPDSSAPPAGGSERSAAAEPNPAPPADSVGPAPHAAAGAADPAGAPGPEDTAGSPGPEGAPHPAAAGSPGPGAPEPAPTEGPPEPAGPGPQPTAAESTPGSDDSAGEPRAPASRGPDAGGLAQRLPPRLRVGTLVEGRVSAVASDHALVDVGGKADGVLAEADASLREGQRLDEAVAVGQTILVTVIGFDAEEGAPRLSQRRAETTAAWRRVEAAFREGASVEGPVREVVKGGLVLDLGVRGFMPASQVDRGPVADLGTFVGQTLTARVLECDRVRNKVILSRRALLEEERHRRRDELWAELEEGQVRQGVVKALVDFGAFIDLGGVDGLLHVSAMSWGRVERPSDLLRVGQELRVMVLRLDREKEKVSLGLKQVTPDPWTQAAERYPVGSIVHGRVARITSFGAFVELEPGVDGLVHISQMAEERIRDPRDAVSEGETVDVKVLRVAPTERRISLSLREARPEGPAARGREGGAHAGRQDAVTLGDVVGDLGAMFGPGHDAAERPTEPRQPTESPPPASDTEESPPRSE